eukprot:6747483-Alexandrium_andersonii.AAC.1
MASAVGLFGAARSCLNRIICPTACKLPNPRKPPNPHAQALRPPGCSNAPGRTRAGTRAQTVWIGGVGLRPAAYRCSPHGLLEAA